VADVFISYAREDQAFVRRVFDALKEFGRETWVDWDGIPPSAVWMAEVRKAIETGEAFVFVITPDSLASSVCREEVAHAASVNKRLIPILRRDVGDTPAPEAVAERNWIFLREQDDFDRGLELLLEALAADPEWTEQHTRLLVRARDWEQRGHPGSLLLRGDDLSGAERWLATASGHEPEPTPLHAEFIVQSRRSASRRQRLTLAGVGVALAVSIVLSILALLQRSSAVRERERAEAEARTSHSRELAAEALGQLDIDPELGVLLAIEAVDTSRTSEAEAALRATLQGSHVRATLQGHDGTVSDAVFSPDGARLLSLGFDATARLWDTEAGSEIAVLEGHDAPITDGAFAPDGSLVATASEDRSVRLWNAEDGGDLETLIGHEDPVAALAFSPDGRLFVSGDSGGIVRIWDTSTGDRVAEIPGHGSPVTDVSTTDGIVATSGADGDIRVSTDAGALIAHIEAHRDAVTSITFSPDGTRLLSTSEDGTACIWSIPDGKRVAVLEGHTNDVVAGALSPDGTLVATAALDGTARIWDAATGRALAVLPDHEGQGVLDVAFSPDGARIVTAGDDATARTWSSATGEELAAFRGHTDEVLAATFDPTGARIATASGDSTVKVWDASGSTLAIFSGHQGWVYTANFDETEERVVSAGRDGTSRVWDSDTGRQLLEVHPVPRPMTTAAFLPDGAHIVTAGEDPNVRIWDVGTGELMTTLAGHSGSIYALSEVHPNGDWLLSGGSDGTARLWDITSGETIRVLRHGPAELVWVGPVLFSSDGTFAVTGTQLNDATVRVWDLSTPEPTLRFELEGHRPGIKSVELSADDTRLLTAGNDLTPRIWDPRTGELIATLEGHTDGVKGADLSSDGNRALTWAADGTARVWDARSGDELHVLRTPAGGVSWASLSDDGRLAAVGETTGVVRAWDARTGVELAEFTGHAGLVFPLFNADATEILTSGDDGTARIFSCELCVSLTDLLGLAQDRLTRGLTAEERSEYQV
jgi:WD40 repeat protein